MLRREDFVSEVPVMPAKWPQVVTRKPACSVPDAPSMPTRGHRSQLRKTTLFQPSLQLRHSPVLQLLALAILNYHPVSQFPLGIGRPCGSVLAPLCGASPCSCELALAT